MYWSPLTKRRLSIATLEWVALDAMYVPLALLATWSLLTIPGIPLTYDSFGLQILESYRRAYVAHDYFPHWFSFVSNGRGSALPMLYHRLHAQTFALLALVVGPVRAIKASVPICLWLGGAGMRRLAEELRVRRWVAWLCGGLLITADYVMADWFIRGAVAELLAFMLVPWFLLTLVRLLRGTGSFIGFSVAMTLLFYAHMLIFYFAVFIVLAALIQHLAAHGRYGWRVVRRPIVQLALAGAVMFVTMGPYIAAMEFVISLSPIADIKMRPDAIAYLKLVEYFLDSNFCWTYVRNTGEMSVEIGRFLLVGIALLLVIERRARGAMRRLAWLLLPAIVFLALQPQEMSIVFDKIPGAAKVQFPLRLLVYIVPAVICAFGVAAEQTMRSPHVATRVGTVVLGLTVLLLQLNLTAQAQRDVALTAYSRELVDSAMTANDPTSVKLAIFEGWEYFVPGRRLPPKTTARFLEAEGCSLTSPELLGTSQSSSVFYATQYKTFTFTVHGHDCVVKLSQFQTPLLAFDLSSRNAHVTEAADGITLTLPEDGTFVRVSQRGLLDMGARWLTQTSHLSPVPKPDS